MSGHSYCVLVQAMRQMTTSKACSSYTHLHLVGVVTASFSISSSMVKSARSTNYYQLASMVKYRNLKLSGISSAVVGTIVMFGARAFCSLNLGGGGWGREFPSRVMSLGICGCRTGCFLLGVLFAVVLRCLRFELNQ